MITALYVRQPMGTNRNEVARLCALHSDNFKHSELRSDPVLLLERWLKVVLMLKSERSSCTEDEIRRQLSGILQ